MSKAKSMAEQVLDNQTQPSAGNAETGVVKVKSLSDVGANRPKEGDVVGDRTVISVREKFLIFGKREGDTPNCGAYVTDYREWFIYEAALSKAEPTT